MERYDYMNQRFKGQDQRLDKHSKEQDQRFQKQREDQEKRFEEIRQEIKPHGDEALYAAGGRDIAILYSNTREFERHHQESGTGAMSCPARGQISDTANIDLVRE